MKSIVHIRERFKDKGEEIFDVIFGIAETSNKEVWNLRKELVRRGLDSVVTDATK